ncbi:hypothetical protein PV728_32050 [Streptomyces europaeiscabiei]|uniref:GIY-YIG nuclease family protein n=1 Tax=Streptomyces europaeiscabiei TaxID=146819 RepID=UPI0029A6787C|nr:GIY-YIG nuclease family protein [Streptomyces europaeiscabiei]MDX3634811.1 hypothetical protein [Streptomyces europaeiscabiei]MDX3652767.1 hypothetical protein [Streptomyces europaeiscabiei]
MTTSMVPATTLPDTAVDQAETRLYVLLDADGKRRYVGISQDPERRAYRHWALRFAPVAQRKNPALAAWLRTLDAPPEVRDLGPVPYELRHVVEGAAILAHRAAGHPLVNRRIGQRWAPEDRARIAEGVRRYRAQQRALTSA